MHPWNAKLIISLSLVSTVGVSVPQTAFSLSAASSFNELIALSPYDQGALSRVIDRAATMTANGVTPTVIFDLDDTLFDSASRTLKILREIAREPEFASAMPNLAARLDAATPADLFYDFADNFKHFGIVEPALVAKAKEIWFARFFSNKYCAEDAPNPGAAAFVQRLHQAGAKIVYLSGRSAQRMEDGTIVSLQQHGFPLDDSATLILKPHSKIDDLAFKKAVFERLHATDTVIGSFDNEPCNINAMFEAFPGAEIVFVDTRHSKRADVPYAGIPWVRDFVIP